MQWKDPGPEAEPKRRAFQSKTPCKDGRQQHRYNDQQVCVYCGHKRPYDVNTLRPTGGRQRTERPPKRAGVSLTKKQINESLVMFISGAQSVMLAFNPQIELDMLTEQEVLMLADALAEEANASEAVKRFLVTAQRQSVHAKLVITLVIILAPRLVRHGVLPQGSEQLAASMAMAAGGTHDGDRGDELGQEHAGGGGPAPAEELLGGDPHEDGPEQAFGAVPSRNGHQDAPHVGEPAISARRVEA